MTEGIQDLITEINEGSLSKDQAIRAAVLLRVSLMKEGDYLLKAGNVVRRNQYIQELNYLESIINSKTDWAEPDSSLVEDPDALN